MNKPKTYNSNTIDNILDGISEKEQEITTYRMKLAAKISAALDKKGWNKGQLAQAVGKHPSVITKWLSGTHNFTSDTLWEIGDILGIKLLNIEINESESNTVVTHMHITREAEVLHGFGMLGDTAYRTNYSSSFKTTAAEA